MESQPAVSEYLPQVGLLTALASGTHSAPARNRRALEYILMGKETDSETFSYLPMATMSTDQGCPHARFVALGKLWSLASLSCHL